MITKIQMEASQWESARPSVAGRIATGYRGGHGSQQVCRNLALRGSGLHNAVRVLVKRTNQSLVMAFCTMTYLTACLDSMESDAEDAVAADEFADESSSPDADAILSLANDLSEEELRDIDLSKTISANIVRLRPFATMAELRDVPRMSKTTLRRLNNAALDRQMYKTSIRMPLMNSECDHSIGEPMWVNRLNVATVFDTAQRNSDDDMCSFGSFSDYTEPRACYIGKVEEVMDVAATMTDSFLSDQYSVFAYRYGATKASGQDHLTIEEFEAELGDELPAIWKNYRSSYRSVLILQSSSDSGDDINVDNIYPCRSF